MEDKHLHIISFAVPFPADYGGAIDVFYKIKALSELGIKIHLHCFTYNAFKKQKELENYCHVVHYYERDNSIIKHFSFKPFIVNSRRRKSLIENLINDDYPILMEGTHSTYFLNDTRLEGRGLFIRMANIESNYYKGLYRASKNFIKSLFYLVESIRLKFYESTFNRANKIFAISPEEQFRLSVPYGEQVAYIPAFHQFDNPRNHISFEGSDYILYHGNLAIEENERAVNVLLEEVFCNLDIECIIAGRNPSESLLNKIDEYSNVRCIPNPSNDELDELIQNASINLLYSEQNTGLKLKLLNVLFQGKKIIVNETLASGVELDSIVDVVKGTNEMVKSIKSHFIMKEPLNYDERKAFLDKYFNNKKNAKKLVDIIFG